MKHASATRRRPSVHITLGRAARLHHLVMLLAERPQTRDTVLTALAIGLRTFYRELELINRCGVKIQHKDKTYVLLSTAEQAEGKLPFPDPQLSFAEMAELARQPGEASKRLAQLLESVINHPSASKRGGRGRKGGKTRGDADG